MDKPIPNIILLRFVDDGLEAITLPAYRFELNHFRRINSLHTTKPVAVNITHPFLV